MSVESRSLADRVAEAFAVKPPTPTERRMIQLVLDNPGASAPMLSNMMGWTGNTWSMQFGGMAKRRAEHLGSPKPSKLVPGKNRFILILADFNPATWAFTLWPEVVHGLAQLGIRPSSAG